MAKYDIKYWCNLLKKGKIVCPKCNHNFEHGIISDSLISTNTKNFTCGNSDCQIWFKVTM